jgi:hypothetical protein
MKNVMSPSRGELQWDDQGIEATNPWLGCLTDISLRIIAKQENCLQY